MDVLATVKKRTRTRWVKRGLLALLGLGLLAAIALAYRPRPVDVDLGAVTRGPLELSVSEPGRTRVRERYVVSAPVGGHLQRIALKPGDRVARGQVVARLTSPTSPLLDARSRLQADAQVQAARDALTQARSAAARAEAALAVSRSELARNRALRAAGSVPQRTLDLAELDLRAHEAELQSAQSAVRVAGHEVERAQATRGALGRSTREEVDEVRSPVDGWVLKVVQESAGMVPAGAPLLELGDPADLEVVVDLLTQDAVRVRPGARVLLEHWGGAAPLRAARAARGARGLHARLRPGRGRAAGERARGAGRAARALEPAGRRLPGGGARHPVGGRRTCSRCPRARCFAAGSAGRCSSPGKIGCSCGRWRWASATAWRPRCARACGKESAWCCTPETAPRTASATRSAHAPEAREYPCKERGARR